MLLFPVCGASWGTEGTGELPGPAPGRTSGCSSLCHQRWPPKQQPLAAGSEWPKNKIKAGSKAEKVSTYKTALHLSNFYLTVWTSAKWGGCGGQGAAGPSPVSAQLQSTLHCWAGLSTPGRSEVPGLAALAVGIALSKTKCIVGGGGNRAEWSSDYGSSTLWELWACSRTVSREGEGSWAPERTLSVLLLNAARLSRRNGGVTTPAHLQGEPWGCPASHPRGARAVPLPALPWAGCGRSGAHGRAQQDPSRRFQPPRHDPHVCNTHRPPGPAPPVLEEAHNGV